jgi:transcriptional regulator with XRE-family HTH domain
MMTLPMALDQGPVVQSAILRSTLTRLRKEMQLTQEQVADELEWSPSKLIRIEGGRSAVTKTDLDALLNIYGVTSASERDRLQELNRGAREKAWWDNYKNVLSPGVLSFAGYEAGATFIRQFINNVIPGLLQTPDYARVLTESTTTSSIMVAPVVNMRLERQKELAQRENPPHQFYILDEAVIRRQVGIKVDPAIMPSQLRYVADRAEQDERVFVRIIPFNEGAHLGVNVAGAFTLLEFDGGLPDLLYQDAGRGEVAAITGDDPEVSEYRYLFESLLDFTLSEEDSISFVRAAAEEMS